MKPFQPTPFWHRSILLNSLVLLCLVLVRPASAATCAISSVTYNYSGSSSVPDFIGYILDAEADNTAAENDDVILVVTYYDINKVIMGTPHRYPAGSSNNVCPAHGSRSFNPNGTATTLGNLPAGFGKASYHYEINAKVFLTKDGSTAASSQHNTPEHTVIDSVAFSPPPDPLPGT